MAKTCIECGSPMTRETRAYEVSHKGLSTEVQIEADWCQNSECGEAVFKGEAVKAIAVARSSLKAQAAGILTPAEITAIREHLQLSQRAAGELLGGGPMAFHKYESGKVLASAALSNLLRVLSKHPEGLRELRSA